MFAGSAPMLPEYDFRALIEEQQRLASIDGRSHVRSFTILRVYSTALDAGEFCWDHGDCSISNSTLSRCSVPNSEGDVGFDCEACCATTLLPGLDSCDASSSCANGSAVACGACMATALPPPLPPPPSPPLPPPPPPAAPASSMWPTLIAVVATGGGAILLLVGAASCWCDWRRRRKQAEEDEARAARRLPDLQCSHFSSEMQMPPCVPPAPARDRDSEGLVAPA